MSSRTVRTTAAALVVASFVALSPSPAFALGRRFPGLSFAPIEAAVRDVFDALLHWFDSPEGSEPDSGGAMDPNGRD
jgi:hypothetical protein